MDPPTVVDAEGRTLRMGPRADSSAAAPAGPARYVIEAPLGRGGMGEVLRARDPALGRCVALKRLAAGADEPTQRARFIAEAQVTAQLDHPNIVPVHELADDEQGLPYYTMKEVRGQTLGALLAEGRTELPRLLRIFDQVCDAIRFAHAHGVLHRDLKPENVMVGAFGEVLVMDWGLAARIGPDGQVAGEVAGTPAYMSPEQAAGRAADARSDQFALGAMLYEMLCGTPPHQPQPGETLPALLRRIAEQPVEPPGARAPRRTIPAELEAVTRKALSLDPGARYRNVTALQEDVQAYLDGRLVGAARYGPLARLRKWIGRHPYLVRGAAAVIATAALFVGLQLRRVALQAAAHRAQVAEAERKVTELEPTRRLEHAASLLAGLPERPESLPVPSADQRDAYSSAFKRLLEVAAAWRGLRRLAPDHPRTRGELFAALLAMGRLALAAQDYTLAETTFAEAAGLGIDDDRARRLQQGVTTARRALLARHRARIVALCESALKGELAREEAFRAAVTEIAYYRERQTVELLVERLRELVALLRRTTRETLLAAREVTAVERTAGWKRFHGLATATDAWLASLAPAGRNGRPPQPATKTTQALVNAALERLARRSYLRHQTRESIATTNHLALLAKAQLRALQAGGRDRRRMLDLACECLGLLGDSRGAVGPLGLLLWSAWDETLGLSAGTALARLSAEDAHAGRVLFGVVGLGAAGQRSMWDTHGALWSHVARSLPRADRRKDAAAQAPDEVGWRREGWHALYLGDLAQAERCFSRALELQPRSSRTHLGRGLARLRAERLAPALDDFTQAIRLEPRMGEAWYNRGRTRLAQDDLAGAQRDYLRAIELQPRLAAAHVGLAGLHVRRGNWAEAEVAYTRALLLEQQAAALVMRAVVRVRLSRLDAAFDDLTRAIELDPNNATARSNRGVLMFRGGRIDDALRDLNRAVELDPRQAHARANRAAVQLARGAPDLAIADCRRAIELEPRLQKAHATLGAALLQAGDRAGAARALDRALQLDPRDAKSHSHRGVLLQLEGKLQQALAAHNQAVALAPRLSLVYTNRGETRRRLGDRAGAIEDYTRALALDPRDAKALVNRGLAHKAGGDLQAALRDYDRAIEIGPPSARAYLNRGNVHLALGRHAQAIADYDQAVALDPHDALPYANRALVHLRRGDASAALADYTHAIARAPTNPRYYCNRANLQQAAGRFDLALADCRTAQRAAPRDWRAWSIEGVVLARQGNAAQAAQRLRHALTLAPPDKQAGLRELLRKVTGR